MQLVASYSRVLWRVGTVIFFFFLLFFTSLGNFFGELVAHAERRTFQPPPFFFWPVLSAGNVQILYCFCCPGEACGGTWCYGHSQVDILGSLLWVCRIALLNTGWTILGSFRQARRMLYDVEKNLHNVNSQGSTLFQPESSYSVPPCWSHGWSIYLVLPALPQSDMCVGFFFFFFLSQSANSKAQRKRESKKQKVKQQKEKQI